MAPRGCSPQDIPTDWWFAPKWLQDQNDCPSNITTGPNNETDQKQKSLRKSYRLLLKEMINKMVCYQNKGCVRPGKLKNV